ncbi:MAG: hypothetical protein ACSNEK_05305 [Parachlamydiaceae bacterium]
MNLSLIDPLQLRNKTIDELKKEIFLSKVRLRKISFRKETLQKIRASRDGDKGVAAIFKNIFSFTTVSMDPQDEIDQCVWDEFLLSENLEVLEKEKRMKELAKVNEWWLAHEPFFKEVIALDEWLPFKKSTFEYLVGMLEKEDEVAFIQAADRMLLQLKR